MRNLLALMLYMAGALAANAADLEALRTGDMRKLVLADAPKPVPEAALLDGSDAPASLEPYRGKVALVNFWATWCVPCRKEMGALDRLQARLGGADFAVVPIATGRNAVPAIERFFGAAGVTHLPVLRDPNQGFARRMAVLALPISVILDREGREVARLTGDAAWDGPDAEAVLRAVIAE